MKKLTLIACIVWGLLGPSCKKYLNINNNPNQATSATPQGILPQAITGTASILNGYNSYGAQLVGYSANAGGYGGFGTAITYNFASSDFSGLWSSTYDNLEDFQSILNDTLSAKPQYIYFNAVSRIMKAHDFQLLVDAYNNIPYTLALKGIGKLTPTYDDAAVIYANLASQLDTAIALIHAADTITSVDVLPLGNTDVLFASDMTKWIRFANTLKLRLMIRGGSKVTFANTQIDKTGFIEDDALINPGFTRDNGKQNPAWNSWAFSYTGTAGNKAWMPNTFVFGFYDGHTLSDAARGEALYYQFPTTGTNRLGVESSDLTSSPDGSFWYSGSTRSGTSAGKSVGVLKGPEAGYPILTLAESDFLQAEAMVRGIIPGKADSLFDLGIAASFRYLYKLPDGTVTGDPAGDAATYQADNATSPLVNFTLAAGTEEQIEAIITQKYLALNFVNSHEAWNEYRRTNYPRINRASTATAYETFVSTVSQSTRPDRLPTRILYPSTEGSYNPGNVPKGITPFTSLIFWAQ